MTSIHRSDPTIGLVIASYQSAQFIDQTLASVAAQTRLPDRVVVVDDASTDGTAKQARRWSDLLPLEVLELPTNGGVARARNAGVAQLNTELVAVLDGDDVLLPDHLALLAEIQARRGGIVSPRALFWVPGHRTRPYQRWLRGFHPPRTRQLERLVQRNYVFVASLLPRVAFDSVAGFTEGDRAQDTTADWDLWLKLAAGGCHISLAPVPSVLYRLVPGSMADDPRHLLRCEITQLERSRSFLPTAMADTIEKALDRRRAELTMLHLTAQGRRADVAHFAASRQAGDWRNRARGVAHALAPTVARRRVRRRGSW